MFSIEIGGRKHYGLTLAGELEFHDGMVVTAVLDRENDWQTLLALRFDASGAVYHGIRKIYFPANARHRCEHGQAALRHRPLVHFGYRSLNVNHDALRLRDSGALPAGAQRAFDKCGRLTRI